MIQRAASTAKEAARFWIAVWAIAVLGLLVLGAKK
jgi:hypothetical protein